MINSGRAKLFADRELPEDAHSAGTGLSTLSLLCRRGLVDQEILTRVAQRTLDERPAKRPRGRPSLPVGPRDDPLSALVRRARGAGPRRRGDRDQQPVAMPSETALFRFARRYPLDESGGHVRVRRPREPASRRGALTSWTTSATT